MKNDLIDSAHCINTLQKSYFCNKGLWWIVFKQDSNVHFFCIKTVKMLIVNKNMQMIFVAFFKTLKFYVYCLTEILDFRTDQMLKFLEHLFIFLHKWINLFFHEKMENLF